MKRLLTLAAVLLMALAGCAAPESLPQEDDPIIDDGITETTGGIRGVVVDDAVVPVSGALVTLLSDGQSVETGEDGRFTFTGLEPGAYFLDVQRPGYTGTQVQANVEANVPNPPMIKAQIAKIPGADPYIEPFAFEGFYECAFAGPGITDTCDMAIRTIYDYGEEFGVPNPGVPRTVQNNDNTAYLPWSDSIKSVVVEGYWDQAATGNMWFMLSSTPITNSCDCSEVDFVDGRSDTGYHYLRVNDDNTGEGDNYDDPPIWPTPELLENNEIAIRAFVPWAEFDDPDVQYALNVEFEMYVHFFHHYSPPQGWSLETRDDFPVP